MGTVSQRVEPTSRRGRPQARVVLAWVLAGFDLTLLVIAGSLVVAGWSSLRVQGPGSGFAAALAVLMVLSFTAVGLLLMLRVPGNPIGWLFAVVGALIGLVVVGATLSDGPFSEPVRSWGAWLSSWTGASVLPVLSLVALLFPDGAPLNRRWANVVRALIAYTIIFAVLSAFAPGEIEGANGLVNPIGIDFLGHAALGVLWIGMPVFVFAAAASIAIRFRRADGLARKQIELFAIAVLLLVIGNVAQSVTYGTRFEDLGVLASILSVVAVPILSGIAVLRHRLYDIELVIRRTVRYAVLVAMLLALAITALALVGRSLVGIGTTTLVAFVLGVLVWPLRGVATRVADRIVFGGRRTPYETLSAFARRIGTVPPDAVSRDIVESVADATGANACWLFVRDGAGLRLAAAWPDEAPEAVTPEIERIPIVHQRDELGEIAVSMPPDDPINASKRALIGDLAANAAPVLRNVALVDALRDSRRRIVAAQDERAKKLERDIHDGAQQQLVALAVKQRLAASLIGKDDARAADIMEQLQGDAADALDNLRALARGIYPPLLADKGLAAAIDAHVERSSLPAKMTARDVGRYDQDVEAAVYFTVLEALQNVAKYADASAVQVGLREANRHLLFEVVDDGKGFDPVVRARGSGLQGMTDRLEAIGGSLEVRSQPGTGTTIRGLIPV